MHGLNDLPAFLPLAARFGHQTPALSASGSMSGEHVFYAVHQLGAG